MRFQQWLTEQFFGVVNVNRADGSTNDVKVYRNSSNPELDTLISHSIYHELRGLLVQNEIYLWDSWVSTHQDVAQAIGLDYSNRQSSFYIGTADNGNPGAKKLGQYIVALEGRTAYIPLAWDALTKHPRFVNLIQPLS